MRGQPLEKVKGCIHCLSWIHNKDYCNIKIKFTSCQEKENGKNCGMLYNSLIHGCNVPYCLVAKVNISKFSEKGIDQSKATQIFIQDIPIGTNLARVQWDDGCNKVLIINSFAKKAGLKEIPTKYYMQVVGLERQKVKKVQSTNVP